MTRLKIHDNGNIGIGTTSPYAKLEVSDLTRVGGKTWPTSGKGLELAYDPANNIGFVQAYDRSTSSWGNLYLGGGNVGIGTTAPSYKLEVNGSAAKTGGGSWSVASDRRLKNDIREYDAGLTDILRIRPVLFRYNAISGYDMDEEHVGVIAQELQEISPHMIGSIVKDGVEYLTVNNSAMTYMLINAVQELNSKNIEMKIVLSDQQQQLAYQQKEIDILKKQTKMLINEFGKLSVSVDD